MNKIKFESIVSKYDDIPVYVDVVQSLNRKEFIIIEYQSLRMFYSDNKVHQASQEVQLSYYHINKYKTDTFIKYVIKNFKNVDTIFIDYDKNLDLHVVYVKLDILFEEFVNGTK